MSIWRTIDEHSLINLVNDSHSYSEVLRKLGLRIGSYKTLKRFVIAHDLDTSHFRQTNSIDQEIPLADILTGKVAYTSRWRLKKRLTEAGLLEYKCSECNITDQYNGKPITLQLDHKNGVNNDNRLENLRFLCPNCHSQTPTYAGRNNRRQSVEKSERPIWKDTQKHLVPIVLNASIDFTKYGWVKEVAKLIDKPDQKVHLWMQKMMPDFYKTCFKRSGRSTRDRTRTD
jgi:5-methylcytosine-specific restriction endonuclease McrA